MRKVAENEGEEDTAETANGSNQSGHQAIGVRAGMRCEGEVGSVCHFVENGHDDDLWGNREVVSAEARLTQLGAKDSPGPFGCREPGHRLCCTHALATDPVPNS